MPALAVVLRGQKPDKGKPNILRTLLAVQQAVGYVPQDGISEIARTLEVTEADVAGVLSYYPDLRCDPSPRHVVRICMGESCVANHCGRILRRLHERLRVSVGETAPGHRFRLEQVFCLGNCAVGPTLSIDDDLYGRVSPSRVDSLLDRYR
jgi:NADH:ubiquinone oxidoreductase subunit E